MSAQSNAVESPLEGGLTFIEQLHASAKLFCPSVSVPYLTAIDHKDRSIIKIRGQCGLWSCPVCGAKNGKRWLARMLHGMNTLKRRNWFILTITAHEKWRGREASVKNIRQGWKKLYNRMRRKYKQTSYVKVWEFHEDGSFHLHIIYGRKVGKRWLKDNSRQCGMGYMVDSSASKNPGMVAGYAAKYLLKSFEFADKYPSGMRRIEVSRDWPQLPELGGTDDYAWIVNQTSTGQDRHVELLNLQLDYRVRDLRPSHLLDKKQV